MRHTDGTAVIHRKRKWPVKKAIGLLFCVAIVFGAGVAVGRGNISLGILSPAKDNTSLSSQLDYSSVDEVYSLLKKNYDGRLDQTKLMEGLKAGLVEAAGDPYTQYLNPEDAKAFNDQLSGSITGIGAELGTDNDGNILIVSPLSGYPAEKAGLKPKDVIAGIDGQSTSGMSIDSAVSKIRGQPGTKVTLAIIRNGGAPFSVTITREKITIPSVQYKEEDGIGYLKISQFNSDTVGLAQKAAKEFKDRGVDGVVLDLRSNPGGYLSGAVGISGLWLKNGTAVVSERRGSTVIGTEYAGGNNLLRGLPTVVLINGGSASASEITAGALRDNGVATLVGDKSFGKGSVQQVERLSDGSELKVTIARWYTPSGLNIDKHGITPDVAVEISEADAKAGKDSQKDKAYELIRQKALVAR